MASKLKNLRITSTDLVDQGANQDAFIRLFKRNLTSEALPCAYTDPTSQKGEQTIMPNELSPAQRSHAPGEQKIAPPDNASTSLVQKTVLELPNVATSARQSLASEASGNSFETQSYSPDIHPEVKKALDDFREVTKSQAAKIDELTKTLEIERLSAMAKKYESIGKQANSLAPKLYEMKKAGGTAFDDYIALLDEHLLTVEKSGLFREIGKSTSGSSNIHEQLNSAAEEIAKRDKLTFREAIVKAFESNPELAHAYDEVYQGGDNV